MEAGDWRFADKKRVLSPRDMWGGDEQRYMTAKRSTTGVVEMGARETPTGTNASLFGHVGGTTEINYSNE